MQQIKWMWEKMQGFHGRYIFCICTTALLQVMMLINPIISQQIVDQVVYKLPEYEGNLEPLIHTLVILVLTMIGFTLFRTTLRYISMVTYVDCGQKFLYGVKGELYDKLQTQDMAFYSQHRTGDLMTRLTGDIEMGKHAIEFITRGFLECFFLFVSTSVYMFVTNVELTLSLIVFTPFIFVVTRLFSRKVGPRFRVLREKLSILNSNAQENIEGNRVIRAFATEEYEIQKFDEKNKDYMNANIKASLTWFRYFPAIEGLSQALSISVLLVGGWFMMMGRISAGTFMAFNSLSWTLCQPMRMLGMLMNDTQRFFASINKVIELYYSQPDIKSPPDAVKKEEPIRGRIRFENVSLNMHGSPVLKNIDLDIQEGETVAIMGATGSGKTTLINCIPRFVDVTSGRVLIDGVDVRDYELNPLRKNIGLASQDVFLFSDTVDGNIAYGNLELSEKETAHFAKLAAVDFIDKMTDGFDTIIGERGTGLSGGQKQRIALARALAVRPPILILDDTTSALDLETEKYIQQSLRELDFPCTKIMVAQRISTTRQADKIVILNNGRIAEMGTHEELLAQKGYYYDVFCLQNGIPNEKMEKEGA